MMLRISWIAASCVLAAHLTAHAAEPKIESCRVIEVLSAGDTGAVPELVSSLAGHWPEQTRIGLEEQLTQLMNTIRFAGGSVYRTANLGEDLQQHLLLLRMEEGEVAGLTLRFEWSPDGQRLVSFDFQRQFDDYADRNFFQDPEPLNCQG